MMDTSAAEALDSEVRLYVRLREESEEAEAEAKEAKARLKEQQDRLWDFLESAGLKTVSHELGRAVRTASIKAGVRDPEALAQALSDLGLLDAFTKRAWRQAELNAFVRERVEAGEDPPEGVEPWVDRRIVWTRHR